MTTAPDPLAFAANLLAAHQAGTPIAGWAIRNDRLQAADVPPVLLLSDGGGPRDLMMPGYQYRLGVKSYGTTEEEAAIGLRTVIGLLHGRGPTKTTDGSMWEAWDELGIQTSQDPGTQWPFAFGSVVLLVSDQ